MPEGTVMKINILQWRYSPFFMLLGFSLLGISTANAAINCTATMSDMSFGNVYPQSTQTDSTATLSYKCTNGASETVSARVCFSIGSPGGANRRQMQNGTANRLNYELYQNFPPSTIWGSQFFGPKTPLVITPITIPANGSFSGIATMYGRVQGSQVALIPGTYTSNYGKSDTAITVNERSGSTAPSSCATNTQADQFDFRVQARVIDECKITTIGALDFGSIISASTPTTVRSSANLINVTCSKGIPYNIGLSPSNGNVDGLGVMKNIANTDTVPYQLQSDASGTVWGNRDVTSTNVGKGVTRIGTGVVQGETVYATVANTDVKPGSYSDTVTVHVNY
ncbi:spore coat protein U domain-containing protein [Psychrobacter sp. ANT_WB68]|uniref:Csu type fimbrial protein n=1 Tax=Psychrobacter sp. ANT_WB68 TaxID=2597355 RepID=UPI0011F368DF|nr:spore coat U domain-containing protein [Psychrobacter sp. ANT_WB68]KAA0913093.1 spore coat U domain-containing protein [Psychrobacter sp. ANT_WB68]